MRYIEVIVNTPPEELDKRCEQMRGMGVEGFVIENEQDLRDFLENNRRYWDYVDPSLSERYAGLSRIKCYLSDDAQGQAILRQIRAAYGAVETAPVLDSDWENSWRQYYQPIPVGSRLLVLPEWESVPEGDRLALRLDPGLTFGTGSHATTRLCLEALESYVRPGCRVLDLGCGSGILGIGALLLGASSCLGCDIDPKSPDVARANAALNGIGPERLELCAGDILTDAGLRKRFGGGYDLVLANIVSDVILGLCPYLRDLLAAQGVFLCSGIIDGREAEVRAAIERAGLRILSHTQEEEWHCFAAAPAP